MNTRYIAIFFMLSVTAILASCQSEQEKLSTLCSEIKAASAMTDDCDKMAQKLTPLKEKFKAANENFKNPPANDADRAAIIDTMSVCSRAYLEISTGTCATHEGVRKATFIDG